MSDRIIIFDTTLRDGEQSPGASMTLDEKVRIAKALEKMKVDVIEAGFAIASDGDFKAIHAVASQIKDSVICSLARANKKDIDRAAEAIAPAPQKRIHTFIATSPIHMQMKLNMSPDAVKDAAISAVKHARNFTDNVEFSPEDAGRSEVDFLCRIIEAAITAGATTINIPDTVGYNVPEQFGQLINELITRIPNSDKAVFSAHCHNDLGLAVANSLAAVANGARQIECTINGLGERAGNTALEEVVMALKTREDFYNLEVNIEATQMVPTSKLVSGITGFPVQPNKAIVGANAFAHEAGIHQAGVLKHRETYEIMMAEDVGWKTNRMVLGKHSGRNALADRLKKLSIELSPEDLNIAFVRFKELADRKHEIFDDDLQSLITDTSATKTNDRVQLVSLSASVSSERLPKAEATIIFDNKSMTAQSEGGGAVDATFKCIESMIDSGAQLLLYSVNNVTDGTDSQGEVTVRLELGGRIINGHGSDTDILIASAKAYINAVNHLLSVNVKAHPQKHTL